jgi:hypothetical protein
MANSEFRTGKFADLIRENQAAGTEASWQRRQKKR